MDLTRTNILPMCLPLAAFTLLLHPGLAAAESSAPTSHVVGGTDVAPGDWRATAGIIIDGGVNCTGVLIAPTVVMTAGHCIDPGSDYAVILDTNTLANDALENAEIINAIQVTEYPNWMQTYDIAILVLERPSRVEPMILSHGCVREQYINDNAPVTIVGYGAIDPQGSQFVNPMQEADTVITDHDCSNLAVGCQASVAPDGELSAGGMGIDSCFGDSGGPLYLRTPSGDFVVGLTSRGFDNTSPPCSLGGIYVRLDSPTVRSWIENQTGVALPESNCGLPPAPEAVTIEVESGRTTTFDIAHNDPDPGNVHTYAIERQPTYGEANVSPSGEVQFTAFEDYEGIDFISVAVTDDDVPRHTATAEVTLTIVPSGCCQTGGTPTGSFWLLIAVVFFLRRTSRRAK